MNVNFDFSNFQQSRHVCSEDIPRESKHSTFASPMASSFVAPTSTEQDELRECQRLAQRHVKEEKCEKLKPPSTLKRKTLLPEDFKPTKYSVICGRTQDCYNHTGNRRFRVTVKMFLDEYAQADDKASKSKVVSKVSKIIREASPEGSFVTFENNRWYEVSDRVAREKIGSQFRDFLHDQYRSSAKAKQARKVARTKMQQYQRRQMYANVYTLPGQYNNVNNNVCDARYDSFTPTTSEFGHDQHQPQPGLGQFGFYDNFNFNF